LGDDAVIPARKQTLLRAGSGSGYVYDFGVVLAQKKLFQSVDNLN